MFQSTEKFSLKNCMNGLHASRIIKNSKELEPRLVINTGHRCCEFTQKVNNFSAPKRKFDKRFYTLSYNRLGAVDSIIVLTVGDGHSSKLEDAIICIKYTESKLFFHAFMRVW